MRKIKRDDEVVVLAGKDKGKKGKVIRVLENDKLVVSGVNIVKKHVRPNPQRGVPGGIVEQEAAIHSSNVALWNAKAGSKDRVGFRIEDGKKIRFFKSTGEVVDA